MRPLPGFVAAIACCLLASCGAAPSTGDDASEQARRGRNATSGLHGPSEGASPTVAPTSTVFLFMHTDEGEGLFVWNGAEIRLLERLDVPRRANHYWTAKLSCDGTHLAFAAGTPSGAIRVLELESMGWFDILPDDTDDGRQLVAGWLDPASRPGGPTQSPSVVLWEPGNGRTRAVGSEIGHPVVVLANDCCRQHRAVWSEGGQVLDVADASLRRFDVRSGTLNRVEVPDNSLFANADLLSVGTNGTTIYGTIGLSWGSTHDWRLHRFQAPDYEPDALAPTVSVLSVAAAQDGTLLIHGQPVVTDAGLPIPRSGDGSIQHEACLYQWQAGTTNELLCGVYFATGSRPCVETN